MKKQTQVKVADKNEPTKARRISSVDELQAIVNEPMICSFQLDGRTIEIPVTRMTTATAEVVHGLRRMVQPPYDDKRKEYDNLNPTYLASRQTADRQARSVMVYKHCPIVAAKNPGLTGVKEIDAFVSGLFSENILEVLAITIQAGGINIDERVNFT